MPLHTAAKALIEMMDVMQQVLHLTHPRPVQGAVISESLSLTLGLPLVSYTEWLARLERSAGEANEPSQVPGDASNPALGLLDYFRKLEVGTNPSKEALGLPRLGVQEGVKASPALRNAVPLARRDVDQWISRWEDAGFLNV